MLPNKSWDPELRGSRIVTLDITSDSVVNTVKQLGQALDQSDITPHRDDYISAVSYTHLDVYKRQEL